MDLKSLTSIFYNFSIKFCNELEKNKSVVSSPLSAEFVLGLLALGTTDPAHSELLTSLGLADDDSIRSTFSAVSSKLQSIKGVILNIANKVYVMDGPYDLHPQLKKDAVKIFDAAMEKVDFSDSEAAANNINTWVENKTHHKIKDLFSSNSFDDDTSLVLVNALYFKGAWKNPFKPSSTKNRPLHLNAKSTVEIPMMFQDDDYSYGYSEHLHAMLLEIPYLGNQANMLLVVPREIEGLNDVLVKLAAGHDLMSDVETMHMRYVFVTVPKFKIETEIDLKELLPKLGVNAIFDQGINSGLTKMLNNREPLYVSKAVQKTFIEVNEEGTEAAAATAIKMRPLCMPPKCCADRPYLFMLLGSDRVPLFIGVFRGIVKY